MGLGDILGSETRGHGVRLIMQDRVMHMCRGTQEIKLMGRVSMEDPSVEVGGCISHRTKVFILISQFLVQSNLAIDQTHTYICTMQPYPPFLKVKFIDPKGPISPV